MKTYLTVLIFCTSYFFSYAQLNMDLVGNLDYEAKVNDIWGYEAPDGTEYAFVGKQDGLSIVSLADPANPTEVFFIEGSSTTWRDIKTWENYAYSVCDACEDGLMVIDLSDLPNSAPFYFWKDTPDQPFESAHNIYIDEFGYAYLAGTSYDGGQMFFLDLFTDPSNPQFVAFGPEPYAHDVYVRDNLMYSSELQEGRFAIYDVSDKYALQLLATQETPNTFTHNTWLSDDGNILFTTDEKAFSSTTSYDISDFDDIQLLDRFFSEASIGQATIPHNVHVLNDYLVISHYTDGCVIVDATHPDNLVEVGNYDTYEPTNTGFFGAWGAYPFLPSGNILISDRQTGLYVVAPNYQRACYLEGTITDAVSGENLRGAVIRVLEANRATTSDGFGEYKTGIPTAGVFDVEVEMIYYQKKTVSATFENGVITFLNIELDPLDSIKVSGRVIDMINNEGIGEAVLTFENKFYNYEVTANEDGTFSIDDFYPADYEVAAGAWSFKTNIFQRNVDQSEGQLDFELERGYEDNFLLDLGWKKSGEPEKGAWVREEPEGAFLVGSTVSVFLSPDEDVPEDLGEYCLVTGNGGEIGQARLHGFTRIGSPTIDMTGWFNPYVSFYQWFASFEGAFLSNPITGEGYMDFKIYNGIDTVLIKRFDSNPIVYPEWEFASFKILDYIAATDRMEFIFEAEGIRQNDFDEAAVDFFRAWDDNPDDSQDLHKLEVKVWPNPFLDNAVFSYDIGALNEAELFVYDALGKRVWYEKLLTTKGTFNLGGDLAPGLYIVQLKCKDSSESFKVLKAG